MIFRYAILCLTIREASPSVPRQMIFTCEPVAVTAPERLGERDLAGRSGGRAVAHRFPGSAASAALSRPARRWDEAADPFTTTVKTTIGRLRAKLGDPPVIQTVRDSGYRIGEP